MEFLIFAALVFLFPVAAAYLIRESSHVRSELPNVEEAPRSVESDIDRLRRTEVIAGRSVRFDAVYFGHTSTRHSETPDGYRSTVSVPGAFPSWVSFGFDGNRGSGPPRSAGELWFDVLFSWRRPGLPTGAFIHTTHGDLVIESEPCSRPPELAPVVAKLEPFLTAPPDLGEVLERYVHGVSPANSGAFSILWRESPFADRTARLADQYRETEDDALAAIIAAYDGPRGEERLQAILTDSDDLMAREIAMKALLEDGRREVLVKLDPAGVPPSLRHQHMDALMRFRDPASEPAAIHYLGFDSTRRAALDLIAVVGGRASMEPLQALAEADADADGTMGLNPTIAIVYSRLAEDGAAQGGLALAESDSEGAMSFSSQRSTGVDDEA